jgi:hypothetical protein
MKDFCKRAVIYRAFPLSFTLSPFCQYRYTFQDMNGNKRNSFEDISRLEQIDKTQVEHRLLFEQSLIISL